MADEVHELAVAIRPEGTQETQDALDDTRENFSETADDVGESTGLMSDFADKFTGAGIVFAGAFGTMVAAIASKMPIISEISTGLDAILTALGLRIDKLARDRFPNLTRKMVELSEKIATGEDDVGAFIDALKLVGEVGFAPFFIFANMVGVALSRASKFLKEGFQDMVSFFEEIKPFETIKQGARDALSGLADFITGLGEDIVSAVTTNIVNPFIVQLNRLIRKANTIEGIDISEIDPLVTGPASGPGGRRGFRERDPATGPGGGGSGGGGRVVVMGTLESETNVDSRSVAETTKPFTVKGVLGGGRGARLR